MNPARKKAKPAGTGLSWLVTFSDLMTLLLAFFILLFCMSGMDKTVVSRIGAQMRGQTQKKPPALATREKDIQLIAKYLKNPRELPGVAQKALDLLFAFAPPDPETSPKKLSELVELLSHPEGVVIVLTDDLLFSENSAELKEKGQKLLDLLTPVILALNADINISGHTDDQPASAPQSLYERCYGKAAAVLEHFLQAKVPADRFSLSGYGPDKAAYSDESAEGRRKNRRIELLLKTVSRTASYI
ncbi:MAG: OmpA family protein [Desulfovibrio sp.]|jgi:chemotaxis protein MotB|nr:OmpA family protein [Desulfovibrio sp.]